MLKKIHNFDLDNYIKNQAVNFDKLRWNRKDINFALFWPVIILIVCMIDLIRGFQELNFLKVIYSLNILVLAVPLIYLCYRRYIFSMFIAVAFFGAINFACMIFVTLGFYFAVRVEIYRRNIVSEYKDLKKDVLKALALDMIFILLWLGLNIPPLISGF